MSYTRCERRFNDGIHPTASPPNHALYKICGYLTTLQLDMIVSHALKAIFIKNVKVAGTSVEIAMSSQCGPEDIIVPFPVSEDEKLRDVYGGRVPQNYFIPIRCLGTRQIVQMLKHRRRFSLRQHAPARQIRDVVGHKVWAAYFKFAIERNPWEKAVSFYHWRVHRDDLTVPFETWLREACATRLISDWDRYTIDDQIAVDEMLMYDRLATDLAKVWCRLGVPDLEMPRAKGGIRPQGRSYRSMYDTKGVEMVARACHREIDAFGFEF